MSTPAARMRAETMQDAAMQVAPTQVAAMQVAAMQAEHSMRGASTRGGRPVVTDGGCCSAIGARNELGGALFLALVITTLLRFARRR